MRDSDTGLRTWRGQMITPACDAGQGTQATFVGQSFHVDQVTGAEILHITAHGLYVAYINGKRVGDALLTPGWTVYDDRIAYQSYPVSDLLRSGQNTIEIHLGDGWRRSLLMWEENPIVDAWGDDVAAMAEITAGDAVLLATGPDWQSGLLPITKNGIYWGESYDARLINAAPTSGVTVQDVDTTKFVPHETRPVTAMAPIAPLEQWADANGRITYDFGQNCGAIIQFTVSGDAGAVVLVEHCEQLGPDRVWDNQNFRSARAALDYTLRGGSDETYRPEFTFMGFRYARVTITGNAQIKAIAMLPVTSVPDQTGHLTTGHPFVNQLVKNTVWSQRSNFIEVPTDCPQRDERLGWTGDAQVFAGTACWLADSHSFLVKFMRDVMADQRPDGAIPHFSPDPTRVKPDLVPGEWAGSTGWGDAISIIPWQLYLHYGDTQILRDCLPAMVRWQDYLWSISDGPIILPHATWGEKGFSFGDWLQPTGDSRKPRPTIGDDCAATLYHYIGTNLTARIAGVLGDTALETQMGDRAAQIKTAFQREFFTATGRLAHHDQTSYAIAFLHDLVPDEHFDAAKAHFRRVVEDANYLIGTGFIGTPDLLPALSKLGMHDLATKVFLNEEVPGWMYQVKHGATTIWERWDAIAPDGTIYDPLMNSYNHYAYGAVCQWLFETVAGLRPDPDKPGFAGLVIDPVIMPELSPVSASHDTVQGPIAATWVLDGTAVTYDVTLPASSTATFICGARQNITLDGAPQTGDFQIGPGQHRVTFDIPH